MTAPHSGAIHAREIPRAAWTQLGGAVLIRCPVCARVFSLAYHTIARDGAVSPSVVCGFAGCTFHALVTLGNYAVQGVGAQ